MFTQPNISFVSNIGYVSRVAFIKLTFEDFRLKPRACLKTQLNSTQLEILDMY
jgi:hypothetical protein